MVENYNRNQPGDPREAEPGRGAPGSQWAVQTAQPTHRVNPPDVQTPVDETEKAESLRQVKEEAEQEEGTGLRTTDGYTLDESGRLNNFAVEPPMYVEEDKK